MYTKKNTRVTFRSNRRPNFKRSNNYSNNKPRNKGNITQQYSKYLKLAKEASSSGDRIQSEYYYQFTDHYYRLMVELGISFEDNEMNENKPDENNSEQDIEFNQASNQKKDEEVDKSKEPNDTSVSDNNEESDSKPPKKKLTRTKKVS